MTLSKNTKIGIIVTIIALILIGLLTSIYFSKSRSTTNSTNPVVVIENITEENRQVAPVAPNPVSVAQEIATQNSQQDVKIVIESFMERFGSYNNQDNFKNFSDIEQFMTSSMNSWVVSSYTKNLKSSMPDFNTYYALNTKVLSSDAISVDAVAGKAVFTVATQREEINGDTSRVYYQNARIEAVRESDTWKIDGVYWE